MPIKHALKSYLCGMIKLSTVIITYNEEKNIRQCLEAASQVADEIVVLDSFSTDKTVEICKEFDVNLLHKKWEGYSKSKNYANSQAQYDFILSLDADEVLSPELIQSIQKIKKNANADDAYILKRITNFCGTWIRHCGWYPDPVMRLWNKKQGQWEGEIHEKVVLTKETNTHTLKGDLLHYSFHSVAQHLQTIDKFSTISAEQRFRKGRRANWFTIALKPIIKFITMYFIKLGFLDGHQGFIVCKNSAYSAYLKQIKLRDLQRTAKSETDHI